MLCACKGTFSLRRRIGKYLMCGNTTVMNIPQSFTDLSFHFFINSTNIYGVPMCQALFHPLEITCKQAPGLTELPL